MPKRSRTQSPPRPRRRRWLRIFGIAGATLVASLITVRLLLPSYIRSYVNRTLDSSPDYDGRIGSIELNLWRGAYRIHDVAIVKTVHSVPVPFFESDQVDFSLDWHSLFRGHARGKITMTRPKINFVDGPTDEDTQTGADQPWLGILKDLFPFRIDKADIIDGEIHFQAFHTDPPVDVYLSSMQATLENLTNVEDKLDPLMATVHATGTAMKSGYFQFDMALDPQSYRPNFNLAMRLLDLQVSRLNSLARAYGDFDFQGGRFDLVVELTTKNGFLTGYAKPLFRNVTIISLKDLQNDGPLQVAWEALVGLVAGVFKNQPRHQFGTRITIEGDLDNPRTSILEIVGNVLRNAFVSAYLPRLEGRTAPTVIRQDEDPLPRSDN